MFPTKKQVEQFNDGERGMLLDDYRKRLRANLTCVACDSSVSNDVDAADVNENDAAASEVTEKLVLIKDADAYSHIFPFMRQVLVKGAKFIIQFPDLFRWLDRTIHDIATVELKNNENCTIATNENGQVEIDIVFSCLPNLTHRLLRSENSPLGVASLNVRDRTFFLHHDWLVHNSSAALASLETFLGVPDESLGRNFPAAPTRSAWHTDICSSALYESDFKPAIFAFYPTLVEILAEQGHWIPDSLSNETATSCESFL